MPNHKRNGRARQRRGSQHQGRVTARTTTTANAPLDAEHFEWEDREPAIWGADSFLHARWYVLPAAVFDELGMTDPSKSDRVLSECAFRDSVLLLDANGSDHVVLAGGGDDKDEAREAVRFAQAEWLAEHIGRDGMLSLALAWMKNGPFAFIDPELADLGRYSEAERSMDEERMLQGVRAAFERWRDEYFHDGWSITFQPDADEDD